MAMDDYMKLPYHLDLVGHPDEDGYVASYSCITWGETIERVIENAKKAKRVWWEVAMEEGITIAQSGLYSGAFLLARIIRGILYSCNLFVKCAVAMAYEHRVCFQLNSKPKLQRWHIGRAQNEACSLVPTHAMRSGRAVTLTLQCLACCSKWKVCFWTGLTTCRSCLSLTLG